MTTRRRPLREMEVLEELIVYQHAIIPCFRCRIAFTADDVRARNIENEHLVEHELGGEDEPPNRRFSHKDPCHRTVTNGNGATTAGSSKNRIAKATHQNRIVKFIVNKKPIGGDDEQGPGDHGGEPARQSVRPQWPARKLKSRGFTATHRPIRRPEPQTAE